MEFYVEMGLQILYVTFIINLYIIVCELQK